MISTYCLNYVMNQAFIHNSSSFYIGLSSSNPMKDGTNCNEPSGNGYARVNVTGFTLVSDGVISNRDTLSFPITTGTWFPSNNKAAYWCLFDGASAGARLISSGALSTPRTIESDVVVTIPSGALRISLVEYEDQ